MQVLEYIQIEENVEKEDSESKKILQMEIQNRINAMNGFVFEISDSDLEDIQEVIETNSDDDADHDDAITFVKEAGISLQAPIHESDSVMNAGTPVGSSDIALETDADHDEANTVVKEADVSLQPQIHESESVINAGTTVDCSNTALKTDLDQQSSDAVVSNADSRQNEHNHEVQSILRQLKDHIPDKYIITFDEVCRWKSMSFCLLKF